MRRVIAMAALALAGCVTAPQATMDDTIAADVPLMCKGPEQCALYWRRAQVWVAQNSPMKIQTATDTIIETYNPPQNTQRRGYRILRVPQADGSERITIASGCSGYVPCSTNELTEAAAFKRFVRGE